MVNGRECKIFQQITCWKPMWNWAFESAAEQYQQTVLDIVTDWFGNSERRPRDAGLQSNWAMKGEQRKWKDVIKVEGRKNHRKP